MYFSFTSLSTVGFGDFHPRSDMERVIGAFLFCSGVAIFSTIIGIFLEMVSKAVNFYADLEEAE